MRGQQSAGDLGVSLSRCIRDRRFAKHNVV